MIFIFYTFIYTIQWDYTNNEKDSNSQIINNLEFNYCKSKYKFFGKKPNYKLEKLIVICRHGDRSPLKITDDKWKDTKCIKCKYDKNLLSNCKEKTCQNGDLTVKGFKQAQELGIFIKQHYKNLLFDKEIEPDLISYRMTKISRTHSTLMGLMKGFSNLNTITKIKLTSENDSLIKIKDCPFLDKVMIYYNQVDKNLVSKLLKLNIRSGKDLSLYADQIKCAMCHNMEIEGKYLNKIVELSIRTWEKQMENVIKNTKAKQIMFGRLSIELQEYLKSDSLIHFISAHDGTLSTILSSLTSKKMEWPGYASAIFIEVWCKGGSQFVRLSYNDKEIVLSGFTSNFIPMYEFVEFLENLESSQKEINDLCGTNKKKDIHKASLVGKKEIVDDRYTIRLF